MEELLTWIARGLVDEPDAVRVERIEEDDASCCGSTSPPDDVGKVIGRQGRLARALRTVVRSAGARGDRRARARDRRLTRRRRARAVGRVGRPHGLDGAFVVERASDDQRRCEVGAAVLVDGAPATIDALPARRRRPARDQARPTGRARRRARGRTSPSSRARTRTAATRSSSSGSPSWTRSGRALGSVVDVHPGVANDNLELADGTLVPLIDDAVRAVDLAAGRIVVVAASSALRSAKRRYVRAAPSVACARGTLVRRAPRRLHAGSACLRLAHRAEARSRRVLGGELELRLLNYRDTTPLRSGQVDDDPYGGGAGMVLRVDVVDAALEAAYGDERPARIVALTPQGRQLDQALVEELAQEPELALLSSRFEGFDERIVSASRAPTRSRSARTSCRAASCRRWCCSTRSRGGSPARLRRARASTRASRPSSTAGSSTRTTRAPPRTAAGRCPTCCSRATTAGSTAWRREQSRVPEHRVSGVDERETLDSEPRRAPRRRCTESGRRAARRRRDRLADDPGRDPARRADRAAPPRRDAPTRSPHAAHSRNPVDRLTRGLPDPVRVVVDWAVTIVGAIAIVLLVKAFVVNPYRIPSSSMEPTLHCARPASGCEARFSDRVLANRFIYHLRDPRRGEIIVFDTPDAARVKCGAGGTFVKRLIGLPGETVEVRLKQGDGYVFINGKQLRRAVHQAGQAVERGRSGP